MGGKGAVGRKQGTQLAGKGKKGQADVSGAGGQAVQADVSGADDQAVPADVSGAGGKASPGQDASTTVAKHLAPSKPAPAAPGQDASAISTLGKQALAKATPVPPPPALESGAGSSKLQLQHNMCVNVGMRPELGKELVQQVSILASETVQSRRDTAEAFEKTSKVLASFSHSLSQVAATNTEMSKTNSQMFEALQAAQKTSVDLREELHAKETASLKRQVEEGSERMQSELRQLQSQMQAMIGSSAGASRPGPSGFKAKAASKRQKHAPPKELMSKASPQGSRSSIDKAKAAQAAPKRKQLMHEGLSSSQELEEKDVVLIYASKGSALKPFPGAKFINKELGEKQVRYATQHTRLQGRFLSLFCARIEGTRANWFPGMS